MKGGWFLLKGMLLLAALFTIWHVFASRYLIVFDAQHSRCLPNFRLYLVDTKNQQLVAGELYAFSARNTEPVFTSGAMMGKRLVAMPGDVVDIRSGNLAITVNGRQVSKGLYWAEKLGYDESKFCGRKELPAGSYWFLGESADSFDSRYWGSVKREQIIGRLWPVF